MHVVLFVMCSRVLLRRRRRAQMLMFAAATVMFILVTSDIAVSWNIFLNHAEWLYIGNSDNFVKAIYPKFFLYLFNKTVTAESSMMC